MAGCESLAGASESESLGIVGPGQGFAPHQGTLSSTMAFMRNQVVRSATSLKLADLDFLIDARANTIGALLMHLAATETYYRLHTFRGMTWGEWPDAVKQKWDAASALGDAGRASIKDKEVACYVDLLQETRNNALAEFKKRDDKWLFAVDKNWHWGPTNNCCKWFHVCEHEANHNGRSRSRRAGCRALIPIAVGRTAR